MHLRVLLIESEPEEVLFLQDVLREIEQNGLLREWPKIEPEYAVTWAEAERTLLTNPPHAMLLSLDLADRQGAEAFRLAQAAAAEVPVVLLVNSGDEALAAKLIKEGAEDFLFKKQVDCEPLAHALRNAVLRHCLLTAMRAAALSDSLTGLCNRAGFLQAAERDRHLAERLSRRWMILVAEPRNLATLGLAFGEQRRELALVEAADQLRAILSPSDLLARLSDRHFVMSIFDTEPESVEEAWARVRSRAAEQRIDIGASIFDPTRPIAVEAMLAQALADLPSPKVPQITEHSVVAGAA